MTNVMMGIKKNKSWTGNKFRDILTPCVMYLLDKLKPFEQKEHFSLKEQNGLGWNLAYVRKGLACQGDRTQDLQVGSQVL